MTRKLVWVVAAAVVGMLCMDFTRTIRKRRRRAEIKEELVRWEGEGGNPVND